MVIRYAEFCTGIGGFRIGIESSNLPSVKIYSNEISDSCEKTYFANYRELFDSKDLFQIEPTDLPDFDMMCAGFPCQPFSQAGKGLGFHDDRGTVFFKLMEIIKAKKPKILFFENVPNLVRHDKGNTFEVIKKSIIDIGYNFNYQIIDSKYFGVPQSRQRVYVVCFLKEIFGDRSFTFTQKRMEVVGLRGFLNTGDNSIPISSKWNEYIDYYCGKKNENQLSFSLVKTRKSLERIAPGCDLDDCVLQIRSSGIRAYSLDTPYPTFAVSNSGGGAMIPVLTKERRHLNLVEMRRIMGFPENFILTNVSRTDAIKQLANAVCPPVIQSICNDINVYINHK